MNHQTIYGGLRTHLSRKLFRRAAKAGFKFRNRPHWGAFKRGYVACRDDLMERHCPYIDPPNVCTWRRGLRTWWLLGMKFGRWTARPDIHSKPVQLPPKTRKRYKAPALVARRIAKNILPLFALLLCTPDLQRTGETISDRQHAVKSQKTRKENRAAENETRHGCAVEAHRTPNSHLLAWQTGRLVTRRQNQDRFSNRAELHLPTHFWGSG